ncbi:MAG: helix-turn-helix transcriptional regulator [Alphaproteobacteria bacterium]|nr:helix-turn-helix transcriptional regulator [Alphaproteobacteria bacterium]
MELLAHARIVMWEGGALWLIDATPPATRKTRQTDLHAHHAIQVAMGLGGRFQLATPDLHVAGDAVAVAPDAGHTFAAEGLIALLFIEPESRQGRAIAARLFGGGSLVAIPPGLLGNFRERIAVAFHGKGRNDAALADLGRALIGHLAGDARADVPDLRIRKVIAWAGKQLDEPVSLSDAAPIAGLSAGRLRHLFVQQTGLPFKTYLLWLRLTRAVACFAAGKSLTDAAHDAGFSDSAHLSRTFRRMFGVTPASLRMT